jgi:hypothetical protein
VAQYEGYHSNKYHAAAACEHCAGIVRHEDWCITKNANVYHAYEMVANPQAITEKDVIILHALGVKWSQCHQLS